MGCGAPAGGAALGRPGGPGDAGTQPAELFRTLRAPNNRPSASQHQASGTCAPDDSRQPRHEVGARRSASDDRDLAGRARPRPESVRALLARPTRRKWNALLPTGRISRTRTTTVSEMKEAAKKSGRTFPRPGRCTPPRTSGTRLRAPRLGYFSALLHRLVWGARHDVYRLRGRLPEASEPQGREV